MPIDIETGALNLLQNCAQVKSGDRLLLVGEQCARPYFDSRLCGDVARVARNLDIDTTILLAEPGASADQFPVAVSDAMLSADVTIFFSRLGDQLRFIKSPGSGKKVMTYTLSREHLGSEFSTADYNMMKAIHDQLLAEIQQASRYTIEAANGTSMSAEIIPPSADGQSAVTEFSLGLFPIMIFPPVNFQALSGRLVLEHFLLSSSTRAYDNSELILDTPVTAIIEDSRMVDFEGEGNLIIQLRRQLERAAAITGGDPYRLNSWHTGINPYTFYEGDPFDNLERWGTVTYGSPRYTHIHAAGHDPGDVSIQLFDASITIDERPYWQEGRFVFLDRAELRDRFDSELPDSTIRLDIGM